MRRPSAKVSISNVVDAQRTGAMARIPGVRPPWTAVVSGWWFSSVTAPVNQRAGELVTRFRPEFRPEIRPEIRHGVQRIGEIFEKVRGATGRGLMNGDQSPTTEGPP